MDERFNRNFPDIIEAYLDFTSDHEATKKIHCWTMISVIAAALERKTWMDRGFYVLYPNLYIFIIGKSGIMKKSTSTGIGVNLLRDLDETKFMSDRLTAASLIEQIERAHKPFQVAGEEVKQSPLYVYSSELAVMLGEVHGSIIELLTTFFDCIPNDPTKPWIHHTKHSGTSKIYGPCLNILGASTIPWLRQNIPDNQLEAGFASRILFIVENQGPDKFIAWPEIRKENAEMKPKMLHDLWVISQLAGEFKVDPDAKRFYTEWYERHMSETDSKWSDEKWCGYMGRKGDHILKLAMVRSVSLSNDLIITLKDVRWAIAMLQKVEPDMFNIFEYNREVVGKEKKDVIISIGFSLKKYILDHNQASGPELVKFFRGVATEDEVIQEAEELADRNEIGRQVFNGEVFYMQDVLKFGR